ncbi:MAG: Rpn family recombination-promoting nuclease/putative transposase [Treponema sp.]|nr:Rpn family recombination-promoting nuclease/putative transposase [Treponema sp.]
MANKDISEKHLEAWNDVFADIVNVLLFDGRRLIREDELESDTKDSMFKADGEIHEQERDVSKFWKNGEIRISLLGFENQTRQDYDMPLRVISYDGASYKQELLDKNLKQKYPVATLVLYFGTEERWTAPKNLFGCVKIPEELKPFINDYKINVFEIAWLDEEAIEKFQSDFKFVAQYFRAKRLNEKYKPTSDEINHVDALLKLFAALTGDSTFERVYNESKFNDKGGVTMCDIVASFVQEGIDKGKAEGKAEMIRNLIESNAGTIEQIAAWVKLPVEEVKRMAQKEPVMN